MRQEDFSTQSVRHRVGVDNQWVKLRECIGWERLRKLLSVTDCTGEQGGRPPYDPVVMFRVVLLGQWHDLSDEELEQVLRVRLDFQLFCDFQLSDEIPDKNTIGLFRRKLEDKKVLRGCLKLINRELERLELKVHSGRMVVDSTIIKSAARPRNIVEHSDDDDPPSASSSADPDAAWTVKGKSFHYGYKEHAVVEVEQGYIEDVQVTPANVHDGTMLESIVKGRRGVKEVLADKAYDSKKNRKLLKRRRIRSGILRCARRGHPLTPAEQRRNGRLSRERFTVEQQFGTKKRKFKFARARYLGLALVTAQSFLKAICCNLLKASRAISLRPRAGAIWCYD